MTPDDFELLRMTPDDSGCLRMTPDDSNFGWLRLRTNSTLDKFDSGQLRLPLLITPDNSGWLQLQMPPTPDDSDSGQIRLRTTPTSTPDNSGWLRMTPTPDAFDSGWLRLRINPTPDESYPGWILSQMNPTPDKSDFGRLKTTPDNSGRTYLSKSVLKCFGVASESTADFSELYPSQLYSLKSPQTSDRYRWLGNIFAEKDESID